MRSGRGLNQGTRKPPISRSATYVARLRPGTPQEAGGRVGPPPSPASSRLWKLIGRLPE